VLDNGQDGFPPNRLHIGMQGGGEVLVDDVEFFKVGGANLVSNNGFESGRHRLRPLRQPQPDHADTVGAVTGAPAASMCAARMTATPASNSIRTALTGTLNSGDAATIRVKARWVAGWPEILFRLRGNWLICPRGWRCRRTSARPATAQQPAHPECRPGHLRRHPHACAAQRQPAVAPAASRDADGLASVTLRTRADPGHDGGQPHHARRRHGRRCRRG
jgi:hypothetical protein